MLSQYQVTALTGRLRAKSQHASRDCNRSAEVPAADVGEKSSACQHMEWYCKKKPCQQPRTAFTRSSYEKGNCDIATFVHIVYFFLYFQNPLCAFQLLPHKCLQVQSKNIHLEGYFGDSSCGCLSSKKGWDNLEDLRNYCRTKISHVDRDVSVHTAFKSASRNSTLHKID